MMPARDDLFRLNQAVFAHDCIASFELAKQGPGGHPQLLSFLWQKLAWNRSEAAYITGC